MDFLKLIREYLSAKKRYEKASHNGVKVECPAATPKEFIFDPIVEWLQEVFPDRTFDVIGPFGICSKYWLSIDKDNYAIALEWENDGIFHRDYSISSGLYEPNSIGGINGLNHPRTRISETELITLIKSELAKRSTK